MRAYFFGNMYLSSIQQGIQAGHVIGDMAVKYQPSGDGFTPQGRMFYRWAEEYKVMILLNAGYGQNINELNDLFEGTNDYDDEPRLSSYYGSDYSPYPFAVFSESDEALSGAVTCFGVILPAKIYNGAQALRKVKRLRRDDDARLAFDNQKILKVDLEEGGPATAVTYNDWEIFLMERLGMFRLAS